MKKTAFIELFKNIKKSLVSFIAITMFIFLGIGFYIGLDFSGQTLNNTLNAEFKNSNSYDIQIPYYLTVSQDQIDEFKQIEDVDFAEGSFIGYEEFTKDDIQYTASITSLTNEIDKTFVLEGRLPESSDEIVAVRGTSALLDINVGDKIKFENGSGIQNAIINGIRNFDELDYENIIEDNYNNFLSEEMTVTGIVYNPHYFSDSVEAYGTSPYTKAPVEAVFFTKYENFNSLVTQNTYNLVNIKSNTLSDYSVYDEEYSKKVDELAEKIRPVAEKINNDNTIVLSEKYTQLKEIEEAYSEIIQEMIQELNLTSDQMNEIEYYKNHADNYYDRITTESGSYILKRTNNPIVPFNKMLSDTFKNLKYVMGGVFLCISFIISYSLITRLVYDDFKLIGTKKALGLRKREIAITYLGFVSFAAIIGSLLSNLVILIMEKVLLKTLYQPFNYVLDNPYFSIWKLLIFCLLVFVIVNLVALFACFSMLRESARQLLLGEKERKNKQRFFEKSKLWNKTSLVNKSIINNALNEKRRVGATIIGIASCVMMIVGIITMKNNVGACFKKQFTDYFLFDSMVYLDSDVKDSELNFKTYFEEKNLLATPVYKEQAVISIDGNDDLNCYICVIQDTESFSKLVTFESNTKGNEFNYKGIWAPESYKEEYKCNDIAEIDIATINGKSVGAKTTGFYKFYSYTGFIFMDVETYKESFSKNPVTNTYFFSKENLEKSELINELKQIDGYTSYFDYYKYIFADLDVFNTLSSILEILYLSVAVLMSIFVVLDLLITFVKEKKRDLVTLMINGYSRKDACKYIYSDTIFLTIISLIIGCIAGCLFGDATVRTFESVFLFLLHRIDITACIIGISLTAVLVTIMSIISLKRIKSFKLSDINSSAM